MQLVNKFLSHNIAQNKSEVRSNQIYKKNMLTRKVNIFFVYGGENYEVQI